MPYTLKKIHKKTNKKTNKRKTCYRVQNKNKIFAKCTSKKNATRQIRLLNAIKYNKNFVPYSKTTQTQRI
jgi:hypothetical protein